MLGADGGHESDRKVLLGIRIMYEEGQGLVAVHTSKNSDNLPRVAHGEIKGLRLSSLQCGLSIEACLEGCLS